MKVAQTEAALKDALGRAMRSERGVDEAVTEATDRALMKEKTANERAAQAELTAYESEKAAAQLRKRATKAEAAYNALKGDGAGRPNGKRGGEESETGECAGGAGKGGAEGEDGKSVRKEEVAEEVAEVVAQLKVELSAAEARLEEVQVDASRPPIGHGLESRGGSSGGRGRSGLAMA